MLHAFREPANSLLHRRRVAVRFIAQKLAADLPGLGIECLNNSGAILIQCCWRFFNSVFSLPGIAPFAHM